MIAVTVIGDSMLDRDWTGTATRLCADSFGPVVDLQQEVDRPGGAALTAVAASSCGATVTLVTALGRGAAAERLRRLLHDLEITVVDLGLDGPNPEKVRVRVGGGTVARLDRAGATRGAIGSWRRAAHTALREADAVLLSDYGCGMAAAAAEELDRVPPGVPVVLDPHPHGIAPPPRADLVTPNLGEARRWAGVEADAAELAAVLGRRWSSAVAVTSGADGVALWTGDTVQWVPTVAVSGDPCGAGDWFAAATAVAAGRGAGWRAAVAAGCAAARDWVAGDHRTPAARRHAGVVATAGCFDVLHVGHLELLHHARSLGDRLVVLLNSDASVRGLKGADRPVNHERDRAALLLGLSCVDEVVVFDEPTPCRTLDRIRPDVFVKGADYQDVPIPEIATLAGWGGRVEFAPLVPGRSTTRVLEWARRSAG